MKERFFWACLVIGLVSLVAGVIWGALVWGDDQARMDAAPYAGGLIIAGCVLLGFVWGMLDEMLALWERRRASR